MPKTNQTFIQEISSHLKSRPKESFERAINIVLQKNPKTVLDIGCASGDFLFKLTSVQPSIKAVGIDKSHSLINMAKKGQGKRENLQFIKLDINSKNCFLYRQLLETRAEFVTILGTLHTFHDFAPILQPLVINPNTKTILIHSPFNHDPVNVQVFHQDLTSNNGTYQSGYNIFSQESMSQFLHKNNVHDFQFIPFVMKKTLHKDKDHPMFNYHLIDKDRRKWLTNGARIIFQEYFLLINLH